MICGNGNMIKHVNVNWNFNCFFFSSHLKIDVSIIAWLHSLILIVYLIGVSTLSCPLSISNLILAACILQGNSVVTWIRNVFLTFSPDDGKAAPVILTQRIAIQCKSPIYTATHIAQYAVDLCKYWLVIGVPVSPYLHSTCTYITLINDLRDAYTANAT